MHSRLRSHLACLISHLFLAALLHGRADAGQMAPGPSLSVADLRAMGPLGATGRPVLDARLRYLRGAPRALRGAAAQPKMAPVSIRFVRSPDTRMLADAQQAGARFFTVSHGGAVAAREDLLAPAERPLGGHTVFPALVAWDDLDRLAALPEVLRIETSWSPQPRQPPLYRTRAMVGAESTWQLHDAEDRAVLGTGILIADLDTGVDLFHPDLWRDDGPTYAWIDVDESGSLTDGDAVDLNDNGVADPGETVRWLDAPGNAPGQDGTMNPAVDHVYLDANGNHVRDFGPPSFGESDPTYGERVFRPRDLDGDGVIEPGEPLVALQSCKVQAVYQRDGVVRRRGVDLIAQEGDTWNHGTSVASILMGGEPGRRFGGIAPGASLLVADLDYLYDPPFVSPFEVRMAWAASEGADIMMYEDGEWIWLSLDGSSNVEQLIDEYAEAGIVQVCPAGNLAAGKMHWQGALGPAVGDSAVAILTTATLSPAVTRSWGQFYWIPRADESVEITLTTPAGGQLVLGAQAATDTVGDFEIYHAPDLSPRGTLREDFALSLRAGASRTGLDGTWRFVARRTGTAAAGPLTIQAMSWDEWSSWWGFTTWTAPSVQGTVTWPATADSAIVVAAFDPGTGGLNSFSGRGPRVDGRLIPDVSAPGSTTYAGVCRLATANVPGGYGNFGGTSAAAPHVAASCALLRQWLPQATPGQIRALLREGAASDVYTGSVPNLDWGYGKLNVYQSALLPVAAVPDPGSSLRRGTLGPTLAPNAPNPFGRSTEIRYALPRAGEVSVVVFDLAGREVARLVRGSQAAGSHVARWDGSTTSGAPAPSGVYLVQVNLDGRSAARRILRIR